MSDASGEVRERIHAAIRSADDKGCCNLPACAFRPGTCTILCDELVAELERAAETSRAEHAEVVAELAEETLAHELTREAVKAAVDEWNGVSAALGLATARIRELEGEWEELLPPQRVLDAMAKDCRSCGECGEAPPCQTCMAGGVCLAHCSCGEYERYIDDDE